MFLQRKERSSDSENFAIEVYEVEEQEGNEYLRPLNFLKPYVVDKIVDGLIVENDEEPNPDFNISDNPAMVEYYFEMEVDEEIDSDIIRKAVANGRFADLRDLESLQTAASFPATDSVCALALPASDIYGLSLEEIAKLNKEVLDNLQSQSGTQTGLYDEEDKTNECD